MAKVEEKYCTYKVFDTDIQQVIYVGMTCNLLRRIKQHGKKSSWWKPELRFDQLDQELSRQQAREREKYWIQHYYDKGHPLNNFNDTHQSEARANFETRQKLTIWLEESSLTEPEKEAVIKIWQEAGDDMEWNFMYNKVCSIAKALEKTHHISLNILDITRLTAVAEGLNIDEVAP